MTDGVSSQVFLEEKHLPAEYSVEFGARGLAWMDADFFPETLTL